MVFDGLMPHIAGGKKMFTNYRFAQPGRNMQQHGDTLYPGTAFPFSYPVTTDAVSRPHRRPAGALPCGARTARRSCRPTPSSNSTSRSASLVATDTKGKPLAMPDNVRLYYSRQPAARRAGQRKSGMTPVCTYPTNPLYAGPVLRALLVALDAWITRRHAAAGEPLSEPRRRHAGDRRPRTPGFPNIPAFTLHRPRAQADAGRPRRHAAGEEDRLSDVRAEGRRRRQRLAGVRLPTLAAPVATHLGWNVRKAGFGDGGLCGNFGSMLPFAKTREERLKANDPRLSLEERYPTAAARAAIIEKAARQLVQDRLLLEDDAKAIYGGELGTRSGDIGPPTRRLP